MNLNLIAAKSKVLRYCGDGGLGAGEIVLDGETLEQIIKSQYLSANFTSAGLVEAELIHEVKEKPLSVELKIGIFERIVVPLVLYKLETWVSNDCLRNEVDIFKINCL